MAGVTKKAFVGEELFEASVVDVNGFVTTSFRLMVDQKIKKRLCFDMSMYLHGLTSRGV